MKVGVDPQDDNSVNEPLWALARMLGRMAARELAAPLSRLTSDTHQSHSDFGNEGDPIDEHHENT